MASNSSSSPSMVSEPQPHAPTTQTFPDERANPFYLHHNDNTGLVLVTHLLNGENYGAWSQSMMMALSVKNKLGFVDGTISRPPITNPLYGSWIRNNHMVICWLANSSIKEISGNVIYSKSAREVWLDLQDQFSQKNGPRIYQLRRDLMNLEQGQLSVSSYFTKLKTLWDELINHRPGCTCEDYCCDGMKSLSDFYHIEYVMMFLVGLNDSFAQVRSQILSLEPIPQINKAFALVIQEEQQKSIRSSTNASVEAMSFSVGQNNPRPHLNYSKQKRDRPLCTHCGISGHTMEKCYKLHGYPLGYKIRPKVNQISANYVSDSTIVGNIQAPVSSDALVQQLLTVLQSHLEAAKVNPSPNEASSSGKVHFEEDWQC